MKLPRYLDYKSISDTSAEIDIDGDIVTDEWYDSDTSAAGFRDLLKEIGAVDTIELHINSDGGDVFEGVAIYNMLKQNSAKVNVYIDGLAASIASVIAMAGDAIFMPKNTMLMIHNPWTVAMGNANELRKTADSLDKMTNSIVSAYLDKANEKLNEDTVKSLMDEETWLTANEALDYGLADEILEPVEAVAGLTGNYAKLFKHIPKDLMHSAPKKDESWRQEIIKSATRDRDLQVTRNYYIKKEARNE